MPSEATREAERGVLKLRTVEERVEYLYARGWRVSRICRSLDLGTAHVESILQDVDARIMRRIHDSPDRVKAAHTLTHEAVAEFAMDELHKGKHRPEGPDPRWARITLTALAETRKIHGLDAPTKVQTTAINAHVLVRPEDMERFLNDPRVIDAQLAIEEVSSQYRLAPPGDEPGGVRGDREPRPVAEGEAP